MRYALSAAMTGVLVAVLTSITPAEAQSSCDETNDNGDQTCSIDCPVGQSAQCSHGVGSSAPSCQCSGDPSPPNSLAQTFRFENLSRLLPDNTQPTPTTVTLTNAVEQINGKLASARSVHLNNSCHPETHQECHTENPCDRLPDDRRILRCGPGIMRQDCHDVYETKCNPVIGKLAVNGAVSIVSGPTVIVDEPNWNDIPTTIYGFVVDFKNCTPDQQSFTYEHTESLSKGLSVSSSKSLVTGSDTTIKIDASFRLPTGFGGGAETDLKFSTTTKSDDTTTDDQRKMETEDFKLPVIIHAMSNVRTEHYWIQYSVPVPYSGTVVIDGSVTPNKDGITSISQMLPAAQDRTFALSGVVTNSHLLAVRVNVTGKPLQASDCAQPSYTITPMRVSHFMQ